MELILLAIAYLVSAIACFHALLWIIRQDGMGIGRYDVTIALTMAAIPVINILALLVWTAATVCEKLHRKARSAGIFKRLGSKYRRFQDRYTDRQAF